VVGDLTVVVVKKVRGLNLGSTGGLCGGLVDDFF
jgi:hypothetical protein